MACGFAGSDSSFIFFSSAEGTARDQSSPCPSLRILRKGTHRATCCSGALNTPPAPHPAKPRGQLWLAPAGEPGRAADLGVCWAVPGKRTSLLVPALPDPRTS